MSDIQLTDDEAKFIEAVYLTVDHFFLEFVRANKKIGYGRMMQIISHEWYHATQGDWQQAFVQVPSTNLGLMDKEECELYEHNFQIDPLFKQEPTE